MIREHLNNFTIAGFTYYEGPLAFEDLKIGKQLQLRLEENNAFDNRAVAIFHDEHKLGFVPRSENRILYKLLKTGFKDFEVRVQGIDGKTHPEQQVRVVIHLTAVEEK